MKKSKKIKVLVISILCILTITIGLSYGYYLLSKVQENNNIAGSKCFKLEFSNEKNAISLANMYPISDEDGRKLTPYSFTITNTCDMLAGYTVNMEMLEGTTLNSKYLDVMVNNEQIKLLTNYEYTDTVITGSTESRILAKGTLAYNDSVDYTVRFWMDKDVEDTESMNKLFKSKIVISATPSSWNPKDAGYDTLHDAILANEYQTTPEDAISKIEAKGEPDLSQTAPIIKWQEKVGSEIRRTVVKPALTSINIDDATSNLKNYDTLMWICKKKNLDAKIGKYELSDCSTQDPTTLDFSNGENYYYSAEGTLYNNSTQKIYTSYNLSYYEVYKINAATKENGTKIWNDKEYDAIFYNLDCIALNEIELESDKSDKGLYLTDDTDGKSYYFRGNVKNNEVSFAGFYWQIIRINGDGSIRLLYNGNVKNANGISKGINEKMYQFNKNADKPFYGGYMYGNPSGITYDEVYKNINDADVKKAVDEWYLNNLYTDFSKYLSIYAGFCGDRSLVTGDGVTNTMDSFFYTNYRLENNIASLKCNDANENFLTNDYYTVKNAILGNNSLTYPIGLISTDELLFSGQNLSKINKSSWSYSSRDYWGMSMIRYLASYKSMTVSILRQLGLSGSIDVNYTAIIRPVINLKPDVKITGGIGTSNDPYVIDTSK